MTSRYILLLGVLFVALPLFSQAPTTKLKHAQIQGCADDQFLQWSSANSTWECVDIPSDTLWATDSSFFHVEVDGDTAEVVFPTSTADSAWINGDTLFHMDQDGDVVFFVRYQLNCDSVQECLPDMMLTQSVDIVDNFNRDLITEIVDHKGNVLRDTMPLLDTFDLNIITNSFPGFWSAGAGGPDSTRFGLVTYHNGETQLDIVYDLSYPPVEDQLVVLADGTLRYVDNDGGTNDDVTFGLDTNEVAGGLWVINTVGGIKVDSAFVPTTPPPSGSLWFIDTYSNETTVNNINDDTIQLAPNMCLDGTNRIGVCAENACRGPSTTQDFNLMRWNDNGNILGTSNGFGDNQGLVNISSGCIAGYKLTVHGRMWLTNNNSSQMIGDNAGLNATGNNQVIIGTDALGSVANTGNANTIVGYRAAASASNANFMTAVGYQAARATTDASGVYMGWQTGEVNTGTSPTLIGPFTGRSNSGNDAILIGRVTGQFNTGQEAIAIGRSAAENNNGQQSIWIGSEAGRFNTMGQSSIGIGTNAGRNASGGNQNILIGQAAGRDATNLNGSTIIGNVSPGISADGDNKVLIGYEVGQSDDSDWSIFIGYGAGRIYGASSGATGASQSTGPIGIGRDALRLTYGDYNIGIGEAAGNAALGEYNVMIGFRAGDDIDGGTATADNGANVSEAVFIGRDAGSDYDDTSAPSFGEGQAPIAIGRRSSQNAQGDFNTSLGVQGFINGNGNFNLMLGTNTGQGIVGNNNIALGLNTAQNQANSNVVSIGTAAGNGNTQSNRFIIANTELPSFATRAAALAAITVGGGAVAGNTYLYYNAATGAIEGVRL